MSADAGRAVGTVERVWVYPVKSLGGRAVPEVDVDPAGLRGDRARTVVDAATGKPVSVKVNPQLGRVVATGDGADTDTLTETLTAVLGRAVRLAASEGGPQRGAAVHLVSRRALDRAATGDVPTGCSAEDPRANLVLALADGEHERSWVGRRLRVGDALLRMTRLPKHCLGIYAEVIEPGRVAVGDEIRIDDGPGDGGADLAG